MGYYHIQLSKNKSNLCKIIPPWVKYQYKRLPMRITNSPDIPQHKINDLFNGFEFIRAYIDNLFIITRGDWSDHLQQIGLTLNKMKEKGLKCNIKNSFLG